MLPSQPSLRRTCQPPRQKCEAQQGESSGHPEAAHEESCQGAACKQPERKVSVQPKGRHRGKQQDCGEVLSH